MSTFLYNSNDNHSFQNAKINCRTIRKIIIKKITRKRPNEIFCRILFFFWDFELRPEKEKKIYSI